MTAYPPRTSPERFRVYIALHCAFFALYAVFGKGFAYAGWQPIYVGELLLALAVVAGLRTRRLAQVLRTPLGAVLACFLSWQVACAIPHVEAYGLDTLRDSVIWGYSTFAIVAAAVLVRVPSFSQTLLDRYRRFAHWYLLVGPVALLVSLYLHDTLPLWPGTSVPVALLRRDDYAVQLAGVFAFSLQGFGAGAWCTSLALVESILGMSSRGGAVAFLSSCAISLLMRPRLGRVLAMVGVGLLVVALMAVFDVHFYPPGANREVSIEMLSHSLDSVIGDSGASDLESTKDWRLSWWSKIWEYTVNGPYFWLGKGYGINLADSDGFQVVAHEEPLRSPHNSHLTILARSGVPGFSLWILLQLTWLSVIIRAYIRARGIGWVAWTGAFTWILAFWLAFIVQAAFDVSLESPMTGIPFWTVFGIGWGLQLLFNQRLAEGVVTNAPSSIRRGFTK